MHSESRFEKWEQLDDIGYFVGKIHVKGFRYFHALAKIMY